MAARSPPVSPTVISAANSLTSTSTNRTRLPDWKNIKEEVSEICSNVAAYLDQDVLSLREASAAFERELQLTLMKHWVIKRRYNHKTHRPRPIEIATTNVRNLKNRSRHLLSFNPQAYLQMVCTHYKAAAV